jgi:hypothetical protein
VYNGIERYHAKSTAPEESSSERWYPVEFNFEHLCWVEIRWIENLEVGGTWEAFRIAGEDLGSILPHRTQKIKIGWTEQEGSEAQLMKLLQHEQVRHQWQAKQVLFKYGHQHHKEEAIRSSHYS